MIKSFFAVLLSGVVIDYFWVAVLAKQFYIREFGNLVRRVNGEVAFNVPVAALTYVLIALGIAAFVVPRAASSLQAAGYGALFGFVAYGIYDLTNYATLQSWSWKFVAVDMAWGTILCAALGAIGYWVSAK